MKKYILFICGHNSWRSQLAEVYFNTHNTNPDIEARSCGTGLKWDGKINPKVVELLKKNRIDIFTQERKYEPKIITREMVDGAESIYTMGCMCTDENGVDMIWRKVDHDFCLDDPARDDTNVDAMFEKFISQIESILKKYNL